MANDGKDFVSKRRENKGVSKHEVNPLISRKSNTDGRGSQLSTETTGSGPIPSALKTMSENPLSLDMDSERVNVRNLWPSRMIVRNTPSGESYDFNDAGKVLSVRSIDLQHLLDFNRSGPRGCCGSNGERRKFEVA